MPDSLVKMPYSEIGWIDYSRKIEKYLEKTASQKENMQVTGLKRIIHSHVELSELFNILSL
jgi:hypothetical protein